MGKQIQIPLQLQPQLLPHRPIITEIMLLDLHHQQIAEIPRLHSHRRLQITINQMQLQRLHLLLETRQPQLLPLRHKHLHPRAIVVRLAIIIMMNLRSQDVSDVVRIYVRIAMILMALPVDNTPDKRFAMIAHNKS